MSEDQFTILDRSKPQVLNWTYLWDMFWFLLLSPRAGRLKIQITDYGVQRS